MKYVVRKSPYFIVVTRVTSLAICVDISFVIKAGKRYFVHFITAQVMVHTSNSFHGMIDLLISLESMVGSILFNDIPFHTFGSLFIFTIIFHI